MTHFGQWDERICSDCSYQTEPEFRKGFLPRKGKNNARAKEFDDQEIYRYFEQGGKSPKARYRKDQKRSN